MTATIGKASHIRRAMLKDCGLLVDHSYGILATAEFFNERGKKIKLIKLKNPWGQFGWIGNWSDKSKLWTPALKEELKLEVKDDGIFWMDFDEAKTFFDQF